MLQHNNDYIMQAWSGGAYIYIYGLHCIGQSIVFLFQTQLVFILVPTKVECMTRAFPSLFNENIFEKKYIFGHFCLWKGWNFHVKGLFAEFAKYSILNICMSLFAKGEMFDKL